MGSRVEPATEEATLKLHGLRDGLAAKRAKTEPNAVFVPGDQADLRDVEQPYLAGEGALSAGGCE